MRKKEEVHLYSGDLELAAYSSLSGPPQEI
jgi:hypothetical protein